MHPDVRKLIQENWPMRHNLITRACMWNAINFERQRRMRYAGYRNGTWQPGTFPASLAERSDMLRPF